MQAFPYFGTADFFYAHLQTNLSMQCKYGLLPTLEPLRQVYNAGMIEKSIARLQSVPASGKIKISCRFHVAFPYPSRFPGITIKSYRKN